MMNKPRQWVLSIAVALAMLVAGSAHATNGYFTHGTGTKNKGMAGGGLALPQDSIDTVNNPAVAVLIGNNMQLGAAVFSPRRSYETWCTSPPMCANGNFGAFSIGPNNLDSDAEYFVIPHFSRSWQQTDTRAFAVSFYGRGGMNTTWKGGTATFDPDSPAGPAPVSTFPGTYGWGDAGVDYSQAFIDLTWAWQINDRVSLGFAPVIGMQIFEAKGVGWFTPYTETFAASGGASGFPAANLTNNGHDFAYGAGLKLGLHTRLGEKTSLGIMYQSRIYMTEFDDYADLFAEQGDMDVPANLKIGLTHMVNENFALNFDIEHIWYNDVAAPGNSIMNIFSCPGAGLGGQDFSMCLGGDNGAGFGWEDMTVYKISTQWGNGGDWTWRAGYSHGDQPIPSSEMTFNILAPGVMEDHFTFGFTKRTESDNEWNMSFMYSPSNSVTGPNNFDPSQSVRFEMDQFELEFSYSWRR
jgi:long-chain fatty acid transport protein